MRSLVLILVLLSILALSVSCNTHVSVNVDVEGHHPTHHVPNHHNEEESHVQIPEHSEPSEEESESPLVVGAGAPSASESSIDAPNDKIIGTPEDSARDEGDDEDVHDSDEVDDETAYTQLEQSEETEDDGEEVVAAGTTHTTKKATKPVVKKTTKKTTHKKLPARKPAPKKSHKAKKPRTCRQTAVARAQTWADAKLQYCQSAYMARDYDSACSSICHRKSNPAWNHYRSDCSGLVSYAWKIAAPGLITTNFAPFSSSVTYSISASALTPGDAVNNAEHVMLFKRWVHHPTVAEFLEEPGCSSSIPHAKTTQSSVSISGSRIYVAAHGASFTAIRRRGCT